MVCGRCGTVGIVRSSATIAGVLAAGLGIVLLFVVPWMIGLPVGLVLVLVAVVAGKKKACTRCGSSEVVPADSPIGQRLLSGG